MRHTDEEIEQAAARFAELADGLDPATADVDQIDDLRWIAAACDAVRADEARLREAVESARAQGRSWNQIGRPRRVPAGSAPAIADKTNA